MAISELHKKKRMKNFALLALIAGWCILIWAVTMVKITHMGG
jgi:uncharacterized membrane protein